MIPLLALMKAKHLVPQGAQASVVISIALFMGCLVTVSSLMMGQYVGRGAELGLRRALGASKGAILQQLLVEAGLTGVVGSFVAIGLTFFGVTMVHRLLP